MIEIAQWHAVIGKFNQGRYIYSSHHAPVHDQSSSDQFHDENFSKQLRSDSSYAILCTYILLYCLVPLLLCMLITLNIDSPLTVAVVFCGSLFQLTLMGTAENNLLIVVVFTFLQLLFSGDVESNPGPTVHKDCSVCNKMVPTRSKSCFSCGLKFSKNIKGVSKTWSSIKLGPTVESSSTDTPVTTSATSSANPADFTIPSHDQVLPRSLDDIAHEVNSSEPAMYSDVDKGSSITLQK